ncbi:Protoporphyrinogen IX oxidase, aerobic, HemY [Staphylococcus equorum subsp. equorum]|uniref:protoporphyrinogen oxidase n=1 Tax=Staphylococcus equorum TaxID=246432 RepID=UPI000623ED1B|nr:protoporphyrinogen oxidase [Staphylococcus equorum]KKI52529.1 Protoporphyrinogen IX oxidase, aerobic, HemY [Staphylococcus equorum subsp. equorum]MDG0822437.1 protoporphyrinogen oxidase [Staphylococcus equorum]MDG0838556.1 protoporphyrinogen oxidase [Staphylococcus equorum]MDN5829729.1 protoporphyrinogen oxidase [Staphylococcus equorum]MDN5907082.1 protoporphyrinogen oxidase [Staphylococcus equorum]
MTKSIAIIGAGITGLSSAYFIKKQRPDIDVTIYEASNRAGGKIQTYRTEGYTIELGPESYLGRKQIMTDIAKEIGLENDLITNQTGQSFIYAKNKLFPIPGGSILGVPTDIKPFLKTKLISPTGKLTAGLDLFKKSIEMNHDISVGSFFRQRLGDEVLENLIEPLMGGIYGTNIDDLSLMSTFPEFKQREEQFGSLIKGMRYEKEQRQKQRQLYPGAPKGQFKQFRHGLSSFIEALTKYVLNLGVKIEFNTPIQDIIVAQKSYEIVTSETKTEYDGVLVATPHQTFMQWFGNDPSFDYFNTMNSTTVATVVLAFDEENIENTYDGTGFVIARTSKTSITACTWTSKKWPFTTPEGKVLIRAYVGKPDDTVVDDHTDEEIVNIVKKDLSQMMTFKGAPDFSIVNRLPKSMPQYHVGHIDRIKEVQTHIKTSYPRLRITGASFEAVGLPDCIQQGKNAVEELIAEL